MMNGVHNTKSINELCCGRIKINNLKTIVTQKMKSKFSKSKLEQCEHEL